MAVTLYSCIPGGVDDVQICTINTAVLKLMCMIHGGGGATKKKIKKNNTAAAG